MSANLEDAIQQKVHKLPDAQQKEVLEFVENLSGNVQSKDPSPSSAGGDVRKEGVALRAHGISRKVAAELRASLATFADWNDPEMDIYDDYDKVLATLNENS